MSTQLTVVHTNDTHGRMREPVIARLRALLAGLPEALYVDAGDTISAGNLGFKVSGEPALAALTDLGCAAMCLGNRETHPRKEIFPIKVSSAGHPLLSANAVAKGDAPLPVAPHVVAERAGLRVGIFGVTVQMFTRKQWSQALCDYWFEDPMAAARAQVDELRPRVDVLIALTHLGFTQDQLLAQLCPEVDLVIGGHSHTDLEAPCMVGEVPVVQAYAYAYHAGVAVLDVAPGRRAQLIEWRREPLRDDRE